jgi:threonine dehydratase
MLAPQTVTADDVRNARTRIADHVRRTPLIESDVLSEMVSRRVFLKLESLQVTSSFKARGALNALMKIVEGGETPTIVTASAGNHGRAIAWAAERLGLKAIVFTPVNAPRAKVDAIRKHGAELRAIAANYEEAERLAKALAAEGRGTFISPYNHPDVIAGAGTIGLELLDQVPAVETIVVPIGGGGLISGVAIAAKALRPRIRIVGVESESSAAFTAALATGGIVEITVGPTIADGLGGNVEPETITWEFVRTLVDQITVVREQDIVGAVKHLACTEHVIAEGAGAAAVASLFAGSIPAERTSVVLVTGANIDCELLSSVLAS